jgi:hypothetical protein
VARKTTPVVKSSGARSRPAVAGVGGNLALANGPDEAQFARFT